MAYKRSIGARTRFLVFKRDNFTCQYCGRKPPEVKLHVDHVEAESKGGLHDEENFLTSCSLCNMGKGTDDVVESHNHEECEVCAGSRTALYQEGFTEGRESGAKKSIGIVRKRLLNVLDNAQDEAQVYTALEELFGDLDDALSWDSNLESFLHRKETTSNA